MLSSRRRRSKCYLDDSDDNFISDSENIPPKRRLINKMTTSVTSAVSNVPVITDSNSIVEKKMLLITITIGS